MELVREAVRSGDGQERLGHLPGRQRQTQADKVKTEKQANMVKVTDTQQRHIENRRREVSLEKVVNRRKGQGSCPTIGFN